MPIQCIGIQRTLKNDLETSQDKLKWLSMSEASKLVPYSSEYLSLLARKKKLTSKKVGNVWYTTKSALEEYQKKQMLREKVQNGDVHSVEQLRSLGGDLKKLGLKVDLPERKPEPKKIILRKKSLREKFDDLANKIFSSGEDVLPNVWPKAEKFAYSENEVEEESGGSELEQVLEKVLDKKLSTHLPATSFASLRLKSLRTVLSSKYLVAATLVGVVLFTILPIPVVFGFFDKTLNAVKEAINDSNTVLGFRPGTHENEILLLDKEGNIAIMGHIETEGQLRSYIKDGVAPIVVDSTTMVDNLNAEFVGGTRANEFTLAFVTKNGNFTTEDIVLDGIVEVGKTLLVRGATKLLSTLEVGGEFRAFGNAEFRQALDVFGPAYFESLVTMQSDLAVRGNLNVGKNITVRGSLELGSSLVGKGGSFTSLASSGNFSVGGDTTLKKTTVTSLTASSITTGSLSTSSFTAETVDLDNLVFINATGTSATTTNFFTSALNVGGTNLVVGSDGKVGIGTTTPHASALVEIDSTTAGFLAPRMTTAQRDAIASPASGLLIYNSTSNKYNVYNGTEWKSVGSTEIGGEIEGGLDGSVLFVGAGGVLAQDNTNFLWDEDLNELYIANLRVVNSTTTNATTTNLFSSQVTSTNLTVNQQLTTNNLQWTNATGTQATTTNFFSNFITGITARITSLFVDDATVGALTATDALITRSTTTNATTTTLYSETASSTNFFSTFGNIGSLTAGEIASGPITGGATNLTTLTVSGVTSLQNLTFTNATGTQATTTNFFSTTGTFTNLFSPNYTFGTGTIDNANITDLVFNRATGTQATTTNFFSNTITGLLARITSIIAEDITTDALTATDAIITNSTTTNATTTNISISGNLHTSLTQGSVPFIGANGLLSQNNSQLFWDNSTNRLGIGLDTPTSNLDISGNAQIYNRTPVTGTTTLVIRGGAGQGTGDNLTEWRNSAGSLLARMRFNGNFIVNENITIEHGGAGFNMQNGGYITYGSRVSLTAPATGVLSLNKGSGVPTAFHSYNTSDNEWGIPTNYERGLFGWSGNVLNIGTEAGGTGTLRNINLLGGNVGIGESSPVEKLHVSGNLLVTGNSTTTQATTTNFYSQIGTFVDLFAENGTIENITTENLTITNLTFENATGTRSTTTDAYVERLKADSSTLTDLLFTRATGTSATTTNFFSTTASSTNLFSSLLSVAGNGLVVDASRNVGIGTASPTQKLDVVGNIRLSGNILDETYGGTFINIGNDLNLDANNDIILGNNQFLVKSTGSVGVGTSTPSTFFSVGKGQGDTTGHGYFTGGLGIGLVNTDAGTIKTSGDVTIGGALTVNGSLTSSITTGQIQFLANPTGTAIDEGSVYINPTSAGTNNVLLGLAVNDSERVRIDAEGDVQIVGLFNSTATTGTNQLSGNLSVLGNTTLGDATSDTLTLNARVNSSVLPSTNNTYDLGSPSLRWSNFYAVNAFFDEINTASSTENTFVINSDNVSADTEDSSLQFERGTESPNAILKWDSTLKRFDFNNFPVHLNNRLLVSGTASSSFAGPLWLTGSSQGTSIRDSIGYINPSSASTNYMLFGVAVNDVERFSVDAEGDVLAHASLGVENAIFDISQDTLTIDDKLQVNGNEIKDSAGTTRLSLGSTNTVTGALTVTGTPLTLSAASAVLDFSSASGVKTIQTGGTTDLALLARYIGIGTNTPGARLDVSGNQTSGDEASIRIGNTASGGQIYRLQTGIPEVSAYNSFGLYDVSKSLYRLVVNTDGNVGIGTSTPNSGRLVVDGGGFVFGTDNSYDIGQADNFRPRSGYFGTGVFAQNFVTIGASGSRSSLASPASGVITLTDTAGTSFNRLQFGGTTSLFPSLQRDSASVRVRLADDSADTQLIASRLLTTGAGVDLQLGGTTNAFPALKRVGTELQVRLADDSGLADLQFRNATGTQATTTNFFSAIGRFTSLFSDSLSVDALTATNATSSTLYVSGQSILAATSGNVGVGTMSPTVKLQVETNANSAQGIFTRNVNTGSSASSQISANSDAGQLAFTANSAVHSVWPGWGVISASSGLSGGLALNTAASAPITFLTNNSEKMRVTNTGNVGIGTTNPGGKLDIVTAIGGAGTHTLRYSDDSIGAYLGLVSNTKLSFLTNGTRALTIDASQNIGIGTTNPGSKLSINGGQIDITGSTFGSGSGLALGYVTGSNGYVQTYSSQPLYINPLGNNVILNRDGGNVGIGTTNPGAQLYIGDGTGTAAKSIQIDNAGSGVGIFGINNSTGGGLFSANGLAYATVLGTSGSTALQFGTADGIRMTLDSSGNVGIGTTTPGALLDLGASSAAAKLLLYNTGTNQYGFGINSSELNIFAGDGGNINFRTGGSAGTSNLYIATSGNVGIGTTSPQNLFHIFNNSGTTNPLAIIEQQSTGDAQLSWYLSGGQQYSAGIDNSDSDKWKLSGSGTLGTSDLLTVTSGGNVGIGTTNPVHKLDVSTNSGDTVTRLTVANGGTASADDLAIRQDFISGAAANYTWSNSNFTFGIARNAGTAFATEADAGSASQLVVTNTGNVGIGTTNPTGKLNVVGSGGVGKGVQIDSNEIKLRGDGYAHYSILNSNGVFSVSDTSSNNAMGAASTSRLTILSNGNVGIGTTNPANKLEVSGGSIRVSNNSGAEIQLNDTQASGRIWRIFSGLTSAGTFDIYDNTASASRLTINTSGNVGMGTTSPIYKLDVHDTGTTNDRGLRITSNSTNYGPVIRLDYGPGTVTNWGISTTYDVSGDFVIRSSNSVGGNPFGGTGTTRFSILNSGNVGIGTTNPVHKLTVDSDSVNLRLRNATANRYRSDFAVTSGGLNINAYDDTGSAYLPIQIDGLRTVLGLQGNVGIGTTNPTQKLEVYSTSNAMMMLNNPSVAASGVGSTLGFYRTNADFMGAIEVKFNGGTAATDRDMLFYTAGDSSTPKMVLDGNGNVGIGTTNPQGKLSVNVGTDLNAIIRANGGRTQIAGLNDAASAYAALDIDASTLSLNASSGGSVGIGTTGPVAPLHVVGSSLQGVRISGGGNARTTWVSSDNSTNLWNIDNTAGTLRIFREDYSASGAGSNGAVMMSILNNGNVGIGTTTPSAKLVVNSTSASENLFQVATTTNQKIFSINSAGQVGVGTSTPSASALLALDSTTQGFLPPAMTSTQRDAISSPASGLLVYNSTDSMLSYNNGNEWKNLAANSFYTNSSDSVAVGDYLELVHNQNTENLIVTGWVYDATLAKWIEVGRDAPGASMGTGDGADGAIALSNGTANNCSTTAFASGRTSADCIATTLTSNASAGGNSIAVTSSTGYATGDEILLIQMTGTGVGNYEFVEVTGISGNTLVVDRNLTNSYNSTGAQVVRVPNYTNVTLTNSGTSFTVNAWNGTTGGVLAFRVSGTLSLASGTLVDVSGKGSAGGAQRAGGAGGAAATPAGGGACNNNAVAGGASLAGNAGSTVTGTAATGGGAGGSGGGAAQGGGGGGGGGTGGGGAGGAHATANNGTAGTSGAGGNGGGNAGGTGLGGAGGTGSAGSAGGTFGDADLPTMFLGGGGAGGASGAGGGGGWCYSGANSIGGAGGAGGVGGAGGAGGGILFVEVDTINNSGTITAAGANGSNGGTGTVGEGSASGHGGGGGGGSGGAGGGGGAGGSLIVKVSNTVTAMGTVTASGGTAGIAGNGGNGGQGVYGGGGGGAGAVAGSGASPSGTNGATASPGVGGAGGDGRIRCDTPSGSCSTTPAAGSQNVYSSESFAARFEIRQHSANAIRLYNNSNKAQKLKLNAVSSETGTIDRTNFFSNNNSAVESGSYVEVSHNQDSNAVVSTGWYYDTNLAQWRQISNADGYVATHLHASWATSTKTFVGGSMYDFNKPLIIGDYIYKFGGFDGTVSTTTIYRAPVSDPTNWSITGSTLPSDRYLGQTAIIGDYVYYFGGYRSTGGVTHKTIFRAPVSNPLSWSDTGSTLPDELRNSQLAVIGDFVYLIGGIDNNSVATSSVYRAPTSDPTTWSKFSNALPAGRRGGPVAVIGDYVYLFGGDSGGGGVVNTIYRAPVSNPLSWSNTGSTIPANLGMMDTSVVGDYVYMFGGFNGTNNVNTIYRAPLSNPLSWSNTGSVMPNSYYGNSSYIIGDYVYTIGGWTGSAYANTIFEAPVVSRSSSNVTVTNHQGDDTANNTKYRKNTSTFRVVQVDTNKVRLYNETGATQQLRLDVIGGGIAGTPWSSISAPTGNLSLNFNSNTTTFTWGNATGASNLFTLADTASNTGTGSLLNLATASGSSLKPLTVTAGGVEALTVTSAGRVGVGTTTPAYKFTINSTSANENLFQVATTTNQGIFTINNAGNVGIGTLNPRSSLQISDGTFIRQVSGFSQIGYNSYYDNGYKRLLADNDAPILQLGNDSSMTFFTPSDGNTSADSSITYSQRFSVDKSGNVSVSSLISCGGIQTNGSGTMSCTSDERLKDIQSDFSGGLEAISKLDPKIYTWKEDTELFDEGVLYPGFIAQNVELALPEAVTHRVDGYLQVNTTAILAASVNAIKELNLNLSTIASTTVSTSSPQAAAFAESFFSNIFTRVGEWLANAANGIEQIYAKIVSTEIVYTKLLCVEDVCVNRDQFFQMVNAAGVSPQPTTDNPQPTTTETTQTDNNNQEPITNTQESTTQETTGTTSTSTPSTSTSTPATTTTTTTTTTDSTSTSTPTTTSETPTSTDTSTDSTSSPQTTDSTSTTTADTATTATTDSTSTSISTPSTTE